MKTYIKILVILFLISCTNTNRPKKDTSQVGIDTVNMDSIPSNNPLISNTNLNKLSVLVLPPFDEIANAGISPDIQRYLESEIKKDTNLILIKFPLRQLINVPYQQVFDKKYCKPIIDIVKTDIIVMSKIDQIKRTGQMPNDIWSLKIKIYNVNTDSQIDSKIIIDSLSDGDIRNFLNERQNDLTAEIKNNRK